MNAREASATVKAELTRRGLAFSKVTARTVSFVDLAREDGVVVKIHGWKPAPVANEILHFGRMNKIIVEFEILQGTLSPEGKC